MGKDEIVEEVRKVREQNASKWNYDLKAILADARPGQKDSGHRVVSFVGKPKNSR